MNIGVADIYPEVIVPGLAARTASVVGHEDRLGRQDDSSETSGAIVVDISAEARRRAQLGTWSFDTAVGEHGAATDAEKQSALEVHIERLKERIEKLQKEIQRLEKQARMDETAQKTLEAKQNELMQARQQLAEALLKQSEGETSSGKTQRTESLVRPE